MRFATFEEDAWELESGEARQVAYGEKFWLPPVERRNSLVPGQLAKLLFQVQSQDEAGTIEVFVERMWVLVTRVLSGGYVGLLANQPSFVEEGEDVYLHRGAEIPFRPEHVVDIHSWSEADVQDFLSSVTLRKWS
jgi:hypothetical protein